MTEIEILKRQIFLKRQARRLIADEIAELKIAFNAQPIVRERADIVVLEKDLTKLIPIFRRFAKKL